VCLNFSSSVREKQKPTRAASGPWFIFVWMCHCCKTFQNCPRDGHVAAFITLKKGLIARFWWEVCLHFSSSVHEKQKPTRAAPGPWFIFVWMCHCFMMFKNCPRDGHVAAFITLKYRIYCKVLFLCRSWLEVCLNSSSSVGTWNEETNKTQLPKDWRKTWWLTKLSNHAQNTCAIGLCCRHHYNPYIQILDFMLGHYGGYHSPPCVVSMPPTTSGITTFTGI
jgi:hypothetical protein